MLDEIFRSIIDFSMEGDTRLSQVDLVNNYRAFEKSKILCTESHYNKIRGYLLDHYQRFLNLPDIRLVQDHFTNVDGDHEVIASLARIRQEKPWSNTNYRTVLESVRLRQGQGLLQGLLEDAQEIARSGKTFGKGRDKVVYKPGVLEAITYFNRQSRDLVKAQTDYKMEGQVRSKEEIEEVKENYNAMASRNKEGFSVYTGLKKIDDHRGGIKSGELVLIAAYTAQFKTTFTLNIAYRAVLAGFNTAFVSLEMSYDEMRLKFAVMHTCHPKFKSHPRFGKLVGTIKIADTEYGMLSQDQKDFFWFALDDLVTDDYYGELFMWQPDSAETTVKDIEVKFEEYHNDLKNRGRELDMGCIDYLCLLVPEKNSRGMDEFAKYTAIMKQARNLSLRFCNGMGLRVVSPWQVSRKGYEEAKKNNGRYDLPALANAAEAERSSTLVMALFAGEDQREKDLILVQCLKDRSNRPFTLFEAAVSPKTGFIYDVEGRAETDFSEIDAESTDLMLANYRDLEL